MTLELLLISLVFGAIAALATWLLYGRWALAGHRTQRVLREAGLDDTLQALEKLPEQALEQRLLAAGLPWTATQFRLLQVGLGLAALILAWHLFLPGLPALILGGIAAVGPHLWLRQRESSRGERLDAQLPLALSQIAAGIQAGQGLMPILYGVGQALQRSQAPELAQEILACAQALRTGNAQEVLADWGQASPSVSLGNLASLLAAYEAQGGGQYGQAMAEASRQLQNLIAVRNHARAKAAQALQAARIMPVMLLIVLLILLADPVVAQAFRTPLAQVAISLAMGVMLLGYRLMQAEVRRVL